MKNTLTRDGRCGNCSKGCSVTVKYSEETPPPWLQQLSDTIRQYTATCSGHTPVDTYVINFDGGGPSSANKSVGAYGSYRVTTKSGELIADKHRVPFPDCATSNEAEYNTLHMAMADLISELREAGADARRIRLEVYGDSQLVINHLTGANFCQAPNLRPYYDSIKVMQKEFKGVRYHWHDRRNSMRIFGH